MLTVYRATPSPQRWSFGLGVSCANWREANAVRRRIAMDAARDKDNSEPMTYDDAGDLAAAGWQKGFN